MELIDTIKQIAKVYTERKDMIQTEEATKNALIMPLISALGYNVFDPSEVVPEFIADVGSKKGEKVDYAIIKDGIPIMLIEAKWSGDVLDVSKEGQLLRYFNATPAKIGILTNGHEYRFYTDLDQDNIMDQRPFLQFSICDITEPIVRELKKFTKASFKIDEISSTASELKYTGAMKTYLMEQLNEPSEDFVRHMASQVFNGRLTESAREKFKIITKKAFTQFISDRVSDRLASALSEEKAASNAPSEEEKTVDETLVDAKNKIETTEEEFDAYNIVKAILRIKIDVKRIFIRDTIGYCNILLDNNIRKIVCRFYFNTANKYLGIFDASKKETKIAIEGLDDIYLHADKIIELIDFYLNEKKNSTTTQEKEIKEQE